MSIGSMVKKATYHFNYFDPTVQNEYYHLQLIENQRKGKTISLLWIHLHIVQGRWKQGGMGSTALHTFAAISPKLLQNRGFP